MAHFGQTKRHVWLDRDLDASLAERCAATSQTVSNVLRAALVHYLETVPAQPAPVPQERHWAARAGLPRRTR